MSGDEVVQDGALEDDKPARKRMKTSTKIVLIVAGWMVLTLLLIGQFSKNAPDESADARLDTATEGNVDLDGDGVVDEVVQEEATDVNGDGIIEIGEGVNEGVARSSADGTDGTGSEAGTSGSATGGAGGSGLASGYVGVTPGESGSPNAVAGAPPPAGTTSGGSTSGGTPSTTTSGGSTPGGATSSTTTTRSTTTTSSGGGGSATSSTSTTPTTAGGGSPPPPPPPNSAIILIVKARNAAYEYPAGYSANFSFATGSKVQFDNIESTGVKHSFTIPAVWDSGEIKPGDGTRTSPALSPGTYTYACTKNPTTMRGTITVS